ncbi:MAG TPA: response regulator transcription factor [Candidatus Sulfomarinibacteraceae bacterium]|nr:response regulator transcription factor [Candidatus Sulfomarinibacteraceae bacterium]
MNENETITVLVVDDHAIVREGLCTLLAEAPDVVVVGEARDGEEAITKALHHRPDVILMDLVMPEMDGIAATKQIRQKAPSCQVVVLTSFSEDQRVPNAIQAGAVGYLMKDVLKAELLQAIRAAAGGEPALHPEAQRQLMRQVAAPEEPDLLGTLTEREMEVLELIAQGRSNREIAAALSLTEGTVKGYVSAVLSKLQVADRTQAALYAVKRGVG